MSSEGGQVVEKVSMSTFLAVAWSATAFSFIAVASRLAIRIRSFRKLYVDDFLVILAWAILLTSTILWQKKIYLLYWQYDITFGRTPFTFDFLDGYATFMPLVAAWNFLFYSCLWSVKFSFMFFFRRLGTSKITSYLIWWWVVFAALVAGWLASVADIDWACTLGDIYWITSQCLLPEHLNFDNRTFFANMAADIFTDLLVLSIPIILLWNVQIPWRRKIILASIFGATLLIIAFAIIRTVEVRGNGNLRASSIDWIYLWSNIEMGVSIIVACSASFRQLYKYNKEQGSNKTPRGSRSHRNLLSYFGFTRLTSTAASNSTPQGNWSYNMPDMRNPSGSMDTESQTYIVPPNSVYVKKTVDITCSRSGSPEAVNRKHYYQVA